jgi:DNA-directed RNA polymerase subunit RPC12/RpoP
MMKCACCGAKMLPYKELEKTIFYKCQECGLSDSRLKDS